MQHSSPRRACQETDHHDDGVQEQLRDASGSVSMRKIAPHRADAASLSLKAVAAAPLGEELKDWGTGRSSPRGQLARCVVSRALRRTERYTRPHTAMRSLAPTHRLVRRYQCMLRRALARRGRLEKRLTSVLLTEARNKRQEQTRS
jgi:hypothetical protein